MKLKRVVSIDIYRIICCISVYSQHFFGMALDESKAFVTYYRSSFWYKTILCFFSSELVLMAFFVTGGFFIPAAFSDKDDTDSLLYKMIEKCLNILAPGLAVILITAGIAAVMKPFGLADMFSVKELGKDIFKLVIGIPGDNHIYYGYPLWFQHFMFIGYIAGFIFLMGFGRYGRMKFAAYFAVMAYTLFNSPYVFLVFCGMLAGELCYGKHSEKIHAKLNRVSVCIILMLIVMMLMPLLFDTAYDTAGICGSEGLLFVALLVSMYNLEICIKKEKPEKGKISGNRFFSFLSKNTYSCYLVHFLVYCSVLRVLYRASLRFDLLWSNKAVGCIVLYIVITPVIWATAALFTVSIIVPLKRSYSMIIDLIKKRLVNVK